MHHIRSSQTSEGQEILDKTKKGTTIFLFFYNLKEYGWTTLTINLL